MPEIVGESLYCFKNGSQSCLSWFSIDATTKLKRSEIRYLFVLGDNIYAQVAEMDEAGEIVEEVRVENANLNDLAQRYDGPQAVFKATTTTYTIRCRSIWM